MKLNLRLIKLFPFIGGLCVFALLIFSPTLNSLAEIRLFFYRFATSYHEFNLTLFLPDSGIKVLPVAALEIRTILWQNKWIEEFNLSESLQKDPFVYQRIIEGVWPKTFLASSPYTFVSLAELPTFTGKRVFAKGKEIALVLDK